MPAVILFFIILLIGVGLIYLGTHLKGKIKIALIILGIVLLLPSSFGVFTAFL